MRDVVIFIAGGLAVIALEVGAIATVLWLYGRPTVPRRGVRS